MKKLWIAGALALALSACATATPYAPAPSSGRDGYADVRVTPERWRVSFAGNSLTSRDTVEMYLLYRAAELTAQQGYDWFETEDRDTHKDTRFFGTPDPFWAGSGYGRYWRPSWRFHRHFGGAGPFWDDDFDVQQVDRYQATAEIVMHHGPRPADNAHGLDARQVMENLGPKIARPAPPHG